MVVTIADSLADLEPFFIEFGEYFLHGDLLLNEQEKPPPAILFLHGGLPKEDKLQFYLLRQLLLKKYALGSCAFDFIGHGSTGGEWGRDSLRDRIFQANDIVYACFDSQPFNIVATGIGTHVALELLKMHPICNLLFIHPRLYGSDVYNMPIGDDSFPGVISEAGDLVDTSMVTGLEGFSGKLCWVTAQSEDAAMETVLAKFQSHLSGTVSMRHIHFSDCSSQMLMDIASNTLIIEKMSSIIADLCKRA